MYCAKCGQNLADNARFCPACGTPVEQMPGGSQVGPDEYAYGGQEEIYEDAYDQAGAGYGYGPQEQAGAGYGYGPQEQAGAGYGYGPQEQAGTGCGYGAQPGGSYDSRWEPVNETPSGRGTYDRNDQAMNERLRRDREARPRLGTSIASLVLGIISILTFWFPLIPVILGLIGLLLGINGRRKGAGGLSTAGITLSVLGLIFGVILTVLWVLLIYGMVTNISLLEPLFRNLPIDIPGISIPGVGSGGSGIPIGK